MSDGNSPLVRVLPPNQVPKCPQADSKRIKLFLVWWDCQDYHHHTRIHNTRIRSWLLFSMSRRGCPLFELIYDSSPVSQWFQTQVSCISVVQWGCFAEVSLFREDTQIFWSQVLQESTAETQFVVGVAFSFTLAWFLQITCARYCKLHGLIQWLWRTRQQP